MTSLTEGDAPERIVASVDYETFSGNIRAKMGCVTVGTSGVPEPFEPAHYVRADLYDALKAEWRTFWNILEAVEASIDLEEEIGEDFHAQVRFALWGDDAEASS